MCMWFSADRGSKQNNSASGVYCLCRCLYTIFFMDLWAKNPEEEAMAFTQSCWHTGRKMSEEGT